MAYDVLDRCKTGENDIDSSNVEKEFVKKYVDDQCMESPTEYVTVQMHACFIFL